MKKIMLFVAVILFGSNVIAQTKTYLLFEFMKVAPGHESAYLETESFWEKIHTQRIKSGEILGWQLWRLDSGGDNRGYQYVTVQFFDDSARMFQDGGGDSYLKIAKKAFPDLSDADLVSKRTESLKSRDLAETFFLEQIDQTKGKFEMTLGTIIQMNFMKVNPENYTKYENAETKLFKPEWQSRADANRIGSWSLLKVITPDGKALNNGISHISLDIYKDFNQLFGVSNFDYTLSEPNLNLWQEALATREMTSGRAILIKKTGKEK